MLSRVWDLLFPEKCVLCQKVLEKGEQDLCRTCRMGLEAWRGGKKTIPFVASWTALWYYEGNVRESLLRYKFGGRESYAKSYGRLLAMTLLEEDWTYDRITWWSCWPGPLQRNWAGRRSLCCGSCGTTLPNPAFTVRRNAGPMCWGPTASGRASVWRASGYCCWTTSLPPALPSASAPGSCGCVAAAGRESKKS